MRFSVSTGTLYPYPLRTIFRWARSAGFEGVELVVNPEAIVRRGETVRQMAREEGIEIFSVHPTVVPLPGWWERRGGIEPTIRLAQELGARWVILHVPRSETMSEGEGLAFRQRIETWSPRLAESQLQLAVENKAIRAEAHRRYALSPLDRLRAFADQYDLGLILDTTHAGTAGEDLAQARRVFNGRLVNVHLSDLGGRYPLSSYPPVRRMLGEHRFPGSGELPLAELLKGLAIEGYEGLVTLEISPWDAHGWWPPAVRRRFAQAMTWLRQAVRGTPEG